MNKSDNEKQIDEQSETNSTKARFKDMIKSSKLFKFFKRKDVQKYSFVTISAITIGLAFGFMTLNILNHVGQRKSVDAITTNQPIEQQDKQGQDIELQSLQAYVIQGGVFSSESNLTEWQKPFLQSGFETVTWKKDDLYYLLLGVAKSEADLLPLQQKLSDDEFDTFIKEWETAEKIVSVTDEDAKWLDLFLTTWTQSMTNNSDEQLLREQWTTLMTDESETSPAIKSLREKITNIMSEQVLADEIKKQYALLMTWYYFEQLILKQ